MENLKNFEKWWTYNLGNESYIHDNVEHKAPSVEDFETWMGDSFSEDRVFVRNFFGIFKTILDAGCGACPEYAAIKNIYKDVKYTGMDITPKLVEYNKSKNIDCILGSLNNIPFEDNSFDIVHSRHVVEHMSNIEKPLGEMIRVASQRVFIPFFIKPHEGNEHIINLDNEGTTGEVYHNKYSNFLIDKFLNENKKVKDFIRTEIPLPSNELLIINLN